MANSAACFRVADLIESRAIPDLGFDMSGFFQKTNPEVEHTCGTAACIAGWAVVSELGGVQKTMAARYDISWMHRAAEILGLDMNDSMALFVPWDLSVRHLTGVKLGEDGRSMLPDLTAEVAVRVLRILGITGKVDWQAALHPSPEIEARLALFEGFLGAKPKLELAKA